LFCESEWQILYNLETGTDLVPGEAEASKPTKIQNFAISPFADS
jgi:hypothetical protein